jgi:hypothetical protein
MSKFIYSLFLLVGVVLTSCSSDDPVGLNGITGFQEVYHYEIADSIVSADSHEFTLSMIGSNQPKDWTIWDVKLWSGDEIPDSINQYTKGLEKISNDKFSQKGNSFGVEWISFEKQSTETSPKLKVTIKENDTYLARGVMLLFGNEKKSGGLVDCGILIIIQKPMPDMEPFMMKIRYKNTLYSTTAHLNMNEEIEYQDPIFSRVMEEIDGLKNVEAIVLEDDIVDYFDMDDNNTSKAIAKIRQRIDSATRCGIRDDVFTTRAAKDGYRFETSDALGYFAMFDDSGFDDTYVFKNLKDLNEVADESYMRNIGLNDKVSSLAVSYNGTNPEVCAVLTIWEDSYYNYGDNDRTKHRISIVATKDNPKVSISKLKSVKCINSLSTWNDRISSYSFAFGNYDSHLKDY